MDIRSEDGYFELPANSELLGWQKIWEAGLQRAGMSGRCNPDTMAQQMLAAGFIKVFVGRLKLPIGPWPSDMRQNQAGTYMLESLLEGIHGLSARVFTQHAGWSVEELEVELALVRNELKSTIAHIYLPL